MKVAKPSIPTKIIYIFGIVISCLVFYVSLRGYITVDILGRGTKSIATITEVSRVRGSSMGNNGFAIEFEYFVNGKKYTQSDKIEWKTSDYGRGNKIDIYYYNNNIGNARIYRTIYPTLVFSIIIFAGMVGLLVKDITRRRETITYK